MEMLFHSVNVDFVFFFIQFSPYSPFLGSCTVRNGPFPSNCSSYDADDCAATRGTSSCSRTECFTAHSCFYNSTLPLYDTSFRWATNLSNMVLIILIHEPRVSCLKFVFKAELHCIIFHCFCSPVFIQSSIESMESKGLPLHVKIFFWPLEYVFKKFPFTRLTTFVLWLGRLQAAAWQICLLVIPDTMAHGLKVLSIAYIGCHKGTKDEFWL